METKESHSSPRVNFLSTPQTLNQRRKKGVDFNWRPNTALNNKDFQSPYQKDQNHDLYRLSINKRQSVDIGQKKQTDLMSLKIVIDQKQKKAEEKRQKQINDIRHRIRQKNLLKEQRQAERLFSDVHNRLDDRNYSKMDKNGENF